MTDPFPIFHQNHDKKIVEIIQKLEPKEKVKIIAINHYIEQKKYLDRELEKEIHKLLREKEQKFLKIQKEEQQVIAGRYEVPERVHKWLSEFEKRTQYFNDEKVTDQVDDLEQKPVEKYWTNVLNNNPSIKSLIKEGDQKFFDAITNIDYTRDMVDNKESDNFTISFYFDMGAPVSKEYFKGNGTIRKSFIMYNSVMPLSSEVQLDTKKPFKKESFFKFFEPKNLQDAIDKNEEERRNIENKMGKDFEIAQLLCQEIIPYSLEYYLGLRNEELLDQEHQMDGDQQIAQMENQDNKKKGNKKQKENFQGLECLTF